MDTRQLFLDQHAAVHSAAVGGNKMSQAERAFAGLSDEQMRVRPREDLNSLAWLLWHIGRAEDVVVNQVLAGRPQVLDAGWMRRLGVDRRDFGIGMTSAEVTELTGRVDLGALREYRDAVGHRTREIVGSFTAEDWDGRVASERVNPAAAAGGCGARTEGVRTACPGRPGAAVLTGIALFHPVGHMGEAATIRAAGGFGTGI